MRIFGLTIIYFCLAIFFCNPLLANPIINNIDHGTIAIHQDETKTIVEQASPKAIINWQSFNISANETMHFAQPANGIALNRISPNLGASKIYGKLTATGKIILINSAGIHFAPGSVVNVGSLIASTADITNTDFLNNKFIFTHGTTVPGKIINDGHITADVGLVALLGRKIINNNLIEARLGTIVLGSGQAFTLDFHGDQLINFSVNQPFQNGKAKITNRGLLIADGGKVLVHAKTAVKVLDDIINMEGVTQAKGVGQHKGTIVLYAEGGKIDVAGHLDVSSAEATGGNILVDSNNNIRVRSAATLNASGNTGGGEIVMGSANTKVITTEHGSEFWTGAYHHNDGGQIYFFGETINLDSQFWAPGGVHEGSGGSVGLVAENTVNLNNSGFDLAPKEISNKQNSFGDVYVSAPNLFINNQAYGNSHLNIIPAEKIEKLLGHANVKLESSKDNLTVSNNIAWDVPTNLTMLAEKNIDLIGGVLKNTSTGNLMLHADYKRHGFGNVNIIGAEEHQLQFPQGKVEIHYTPYAAAHPYYYDKHVLVNNVDQQFLAVRQNSSVATNSQNIPLSAASFASEDFLSPKPDNELPPIQTRALSPQEVKSYVMVSPAVRSGGESDTSSAVLVSSADSFVAVSPAKNSAKPLSVSPEVNSVSSLKASNRSSNESYMVVTIESESTGVLSLSDSLSSSEASPFTGLLSLSLNDMPIAQSSVHLTPITESLIQLVSPSDFESDVSVLGLSRLFASEEVLPNANAIAVQALGAPAEVNVDAPASTSLPPGKQIKYIHDYLPISNEGTNGLSKQALCNIFPDSPACENILRL